MFSVVPTVKEPRNVIRCTHFLYCILSLGLYNVILLLTASFLYFLQFTSSIRRLIQSTLDNDSDCAYKHACNWDAWIFCYVHLT